jgi:hypothetical protein
MDKLTDKVKQIYDTYANENTHFERIALVGSNGFLRLSAVVLAPSVVETIPPSRQL